MGNPPVGVNGRAAQLPLYLLMHILNANRRRLRLLRRDEIRLS